MGAEERKPPSDSYDSHVGALLRVWVKNEEGMYLALNELDGFFSSLDFHVEELD
jgi:hypothetical protein